MKCLVSMRLPTLSVVLLLQLLNPPTSSYSVNFSRISPRRWIGLQTTASNDNDIVGDEKDTNEKISSPNLFEKAVRNVSKNKNYKFGDLTKKAVTSTTKGVEGAVRTVTKNEDYKFGDLTKNVVSSSTGVLEGAVKSIIKKDDYKFGDLTKGTIKRVKSTTGSVMTYSEKTLSLMREANVHELVELMNFFWTNNMTYDEQKEAFAVFVYLGAIIVLSYNFVANFMSGMVFAAAWARVALETGKSPLAPGMWSIFLQTRATFDMVFGGPFLPLRVAATIPWFFKYRKLVVGVAYLNPIREKFPILNRIFSLVFSWILANLVLVGGVTYGMVRLGSLWTGVPIS